MKSIYEKITLILIIGFVLQIALFGVFYKHVVVNHVIAEINQQEEMRHEILQQVSVVVQKNMYNSNGVQQVLDSFAKKYKVEFQIKNMQEEVVYKSSNVYSANTTTIQEMENIKNGSKLQYVLYGHFPERISGSNMHQDKTRIFIGTIILLLFFVISYFIYRILADPLKKLGKAINAVEYGNTIVKIPYNGDDEFGMLCRSLENMGERLKKSEKLQIDMLQALSHDLKTPLTSIMGYSKRLLEEKVPEQRIHTYNDTIYRKAIELKSLLEELEEYSYIDAENKYKKINVNLDVYFNDMCEEIKREVESKGGSFQCDKNFESHISISIDVNKMKRVFMNIVTNSLKYAGTTCNISLKGFCSEDKVYFEFCDDGEGVPEEQIKRIFDRFYRVDSSRNREKGGTGLGLAICKNIVVGHGGEIYADNIENIGFKIVIVLPLLGLQ